MTEVIVQCSIPAQRFALLVLTLSASEHRPDDSEEYLRTVLDMTQEQLDAARSEYVERLEEWNDAHGSTEHRGTQ